MKAGKQARKIWPDQPGKAAQKDVDARWILKVGDKIRIRAAIEHVLAHQNDLFGLLIRTIGLTRAEAKLTLANLAYNFNRLIFHESRAAMG